MAKTVLKNEKVGIVGSGLIGRGWAMLFASVGYTVDLFDVEPDKVEEALVDIHNQLTSLEKKGYLRGNLTAAEQYALIRKCDTLEKCVKGSKHVQECVFERLDIKKQVFEQLDQYADDKVVLCSSTSCLLPSKFSENLEHRKQVIVGHPVNPLYYVPLVELVVAPWTDPDVTTRTRALMIEIGQKPITLKKEIPGFILNRVQYAILNECWRLVEGDVISTEDVDTMMSAGLGMRYAFLGPLETAHLNAPRGMLDYCDRYAQGIYDVAQTFGPVPRMGGETAKKVNEELCKKIPVEKIPDWCKWRNESLSALAKLKQEREKESA